VLPKALAPFSQYCLNTGLLPAPVLPLTVTFQPDSELVSSTAKLLIVAWLVWALPFSVTAGSAGTLGVTSNWKVPLAAGFRAKVTAPQDEFGASEPVFETVPSLACTRTLRRVLAVRGWRITEKKACADRSAALAYAEGRRSSSASA